MYTNSTDMVLWAGEGSQPLPHDRRDVSDRKHCAPLLPRTIRGRGENGGARILPCMDNGVYGEDGKGWGMGWDGMGNGGWQGGRRGWWRCGWGKEVDVDVDGLGE